MSRHHSEPTQFGDYLLHDMLALGGMAEIYRATSTTDTGFRRTLVIKRLLPHLRDDPRGEFIQRFLAEAELMSRLTHPKLVQLVDYGEVDGHYFIAMEHVDGVDCSSLLRTCTALQCRPSTGIAVQIAAEVLDALDHAHRLTDESGAPLGIVHRDVSPSNVLISWQGQVKLSDFGIARVEAWHQLTDPGSLKGKYGYLAPEAVAGEEVDHRADIFSVGVLLAELLIVRRLFNAETPLDILLQVRDADLSRLDRCGEHVDSSLRLILDSALARNRERRFPDAATFRDALHQYMINKQILVRDTEVRRFLRELDQASMHTAAPLRDRRPSEQPTPSIPPPERYRPPVTPPPGTEPTSVIKRLAARGTPAIVSAYDPTPDELAQAPLPPLPPTTPATATPRPALPPQAAPPPVEPLQVDLSPELQAEPADHNRPAPPLDSTEQLRGEHEVAATLLRTSSDRLPALPPPKQQGRLERRSLAKLLFELCVQEASGLLVFQRDEVVKEVALLGGDPQHVTSNDPKELFGQYLLRQQVITEGQLQRALALLPRFDGKLGAALVALRILGPMEVMRHLTVQVRQKLLEIFTWEAGDYRFFDQLKVPQDSAPLGLDGYEIVGAGLLALPEALVQRRLEPLRHSRPRAVDPPPMPPEVFRVGRQARELFGSLDGGATVTELLLRLEHDEQRAFHSRLLLLLLETGLATA